MDKTFEVEVVRLNGSIANHIAIRISRSGGRDLVILAVESDCGAFRHFLNLLPSEAVTIGEQLIAAGKAEG